MDKYKNRFLPVSSWVLYDLANTVFAAVMVTFYFPPYIKALTGSNTWVGAANTASMIAAGLAVPVLGIIADFTGRAKRNLVILTLACIGSMAAVSLFPGEISYVWAMIILFMTANFTFQSALVFYNSLLPDVATSDRKGLVSGLGIGVGYLGTVGALFAMLPVYENLGIRYVFVFSAAIFAIFSIPLFLFVRERPVRDARKTGISELRPVFRELKNTLIKLKSDRKVLFFLLGNFLCVDALNTVIIFSRNTIEEFFGYSTGQLTMIIAGLSLAALVAGIYTGRLSDKIGAKKTYIASALCFLAGLVLCIVFSGGPERVFIAAFVGLGAIGLAGIWTAGRKLLLDLAPKEKVGEYFGLYGITLKISVIGSLVFGLVSDLPNSDFLGYQLAVGSLFLFLVPGLILIILIPEK